jgi:hypothetical protein
MKHRSRTVRFHLHTSIGFLSNRNVPVHSSSWRHVKCCSRALDKVETTSQYERPPMPDRIRLIRGQRGNEWKKDLPLHVYNKMSEERCWEIDCIIRINNVDQWRKGTSCIIFYLTSNVQSQSLNKSFVKASSNPVSNDQLHLCCVRSCMMDRANAHRSNPFSIRFRFYFFKRISQAKNHKIGIRRNQRVLHQWIVQTMYANRRAGLSSCIARETYVHREKSEGWQGNALQVGASLCSSSPPLVCSF